MSSKLWPNAGRIVASLTGEAQSGRGSLLGRCGKMVSLLLLGLLPAKGLEAQAQDQSCTGVEGLTRISLDNGGIANWNFQNPRRPYPVLHARSGVGVVKPASKECFEATFTAPDDRQPVVRFVNDTPDRLFEVRVPFKLPKLVFGPQGNVCTWPDVSPAPSG